MIRVHRLCSMLVAGFVLTAALASAAPVKEADPLRKGTKWKGKVTQKGQIAGMDMPLDLDAELTITRREGDTFEAELYEKNDDGIELTYLVKGKIGKAKDGKGYRVEFKSYDFKNAKSLTFLNIPYTGTIEGWKLKGTWKHPPSDDGTTIAGDFRLELVK